MIKQFAKIISNFIFILHKLHIPDFTQYFCLCLTYGNKQNQQQNRTWRRYYLCANLRFFSSHWDIVSVWKDLSACIASLIKSPSYLGDSSDKAINSTAQHPASVWPLTTSHSRERELNVLFVNGSYTRYQLGAPSFDCRRCRRRGRPSLVLLHIYLFLLYLSSGYGFIYIIISLEKWTSFINISELFRN